MRIQYRTCSSGSTHRHTDFVCALKTAPAAQGPRTDTDFVCALNTAPAAQGPRTDTQILCVHLIPHLQLRVHAQPYRFCVRTLKPHL